MPYANNQGVRIYYEIEGEGPPLVLVHGLGVSIDHWRQVGYVEALKNDYRLILVDARGHGSSDKPHDPAAYSLELMATDIVALLDGLHTARAHFLGYSFGGWIGWGIAEHAPERFHSLIVGGAAPPREVLPEEPKSFLNLFQKGMDAWLSEVEPMWGSRWTPEVMAMGRANDLDALIALVSADDRVRGRDFEDILPTVMIPCLLYVGVDDGSYAGAKKASEAIPNATFVSFPGLNHVEALYRLDLVLPHVRRFLAQVGEC